MINENKEIIRKFLKTECKLTCFQLWTEYINDSNGNVAVFFINGGGFIGNGFVSISTNENEAIELMKKAQPERDWNMFEIEKYGKFTIVLA